MLKRAIVVSVLLVSAYLAVTVDLGHGTLWQHLQDVWQSDEMMDLKDDLARPWRSSSLATTRPSP